MHRSQKDACLFCRNGTLQNWTVEHNNIVIPNEALNAPQVSYECELGKKSALSQLYEMCTL